MRHGFIFQAFYSFAIVLKNRFKKSSEAKKGVRPEGSGKSGFFPDPSIPESGSKRVRFPHWNHLHLDCHCNIFSNCNQLNKFQNFLIFFTYTKSGNVLYYPALTKLNKSNKNNNDIKYCHGPCLIAVAYFMSFFVCFIFVCRQQK